MVMLISLAALSCKKNNSTKWITANATIINEGDVAADGCGWLVKINRPDSSIYSPINLATAYKVNNLQVNITYQILTDKLACGGLPEPLDGGLTEIQVIAIRKNN